MSIELKRTKKYKKFLKGDIYGYNGKIIETDP